MKTVITFLHFLGLICVSLQNCEYRHDTHLSIIDKWWTGDENPKVFDGWNFFCNGLTSLLNLQDYMHYSNEFSTMVVVNGSFSKLFLVTQGYYDDNLKGLKFYNNSITSIEPSSPAHFNNLQEISLKQNNITFLSEGLFTANHRLRIVDLSYNNISAVENTTFVSNSITHLNLRHNQLQKVDFKLPNWLINLELSFNLISYIAKNVFSETAELKTLKLNNNIIKTLPIGLFTSNNNLHELDLSHNSISAVGKVTFSFQIKNLNLQSNNLQTLGFILPIFSQLLDLSFNQISFIDNSSFSGMALLTILRLNNNRLQNLPAGLFSSMDSLKELYLQHNNITLLTNGWFESNNNLKILDLSYNSIFYVGDVALVSRSIQYLNLQYNKIQNVNFTLPVYIDHLDLGFNLIDQINENCFLETTALRELNLSNNFLKTIPPGLFRSLDDVKDINLQHNNIIFIPNELLSPHDSLNNVTLNLSHNNISFINRDSFPTRAVTNLYLQHNKLQRINYTLPTSLKYLNLSFNSLSVIEKDTFQNLTVLQTLWLNNNLLQALPAGCFQTLDGVEYLELSSNKLVMTFGTFTGLRNLKTLKIANNSLADLPELVLNDLEHIVVLDVSNNLLTNLEAADITKHLKNLVLIYLEGNRFLCTYLLKLITQFQKSGVEVKKGDQFFRSNVRGITCIDDQQSTSNASNSAGMQGNVLVDVKETKQTLKQVVTDLLSEKEKSDNIFEKQLQHILEEITILLKNSSLAAEQQLQLISTKLSSNSSLEGLKQILKEIHYDNVILTRKMSNSSEGRLQSTLNQIISNLISAKNLSDSVGEQLRDTLKEINSNLVAARKMANASEERLEHILEGISSIVMELKKRNGSFQQSTSSAVKPDFAEKDYLRATHTEDLEILLRNMSNLISNNYGSGNNATDIIQTLILCVFLVIIILFVLYYYYYKKSNVKKDRHPDSLTELSSLQQLQE